MTRNEARATEIAVANLARLLAQDPRMQPELQRARRQFFGTDGPTAPVVRGAADSAELRFVEWFTLERHSEVLGLVPVDLPLYAEFSEELLGSVVGVFAVLSVSDLGVEARDLQDDNVFDLAVPAGSLQPGDLLVGRLFSPDGGRWTPSTGAAVFRPGKELGEAFRTDIARIELDRRLQQVELEHLLLRRTDQTPSPTADSVPIPPIEHLEARLEHLLRQGDSQHAAVAISEQLANVARPGPILGPLLEELAFDTAVDLDRVREVLMEIWNAYHPEVVGEVPPAGAGSAEGALPEVGVLDAGQVPGESLGERLVRTLDEGLRQKVDVDELFAHLERLAGLEPGSSDEGENPFDREADEEEDRDGPDPDPGGDLGPLVQEFLWENGIEDGPIAQTLQGWADLQRNSAVVRTDLELVTGQDLMRLLLHVYLGAMPGQRSVAVRTAFAALQRFYAWAATTFELSVGEALLECRGALLDQVERIDRAGVLLTTQTGARVRPQFLEVEDLGPRGFGVRADEGGNHWLEAAPEAAAELRVGDLLLGALEARGVGQALIGLVVVMPHDARALME
jgi:hypothetical protein